MVFPQKRCVMRSYKWIYDFAHVSISGYGLVRPAHSLSIYSIASIQLCCTELRAVRVSNERCFPLLPPSEHCISMRACEWKRKQERPAQLQEFEFWYTVRHHLTLALGAVAARVKNTTVLYATPPMPTVGIICIKKQSQVDNERTKTRRRLRNMRRSSLIKYIV